MNREPANKSMGFFAIYKEAYKLTSSNKKIFSQITLTILLPSAFFFLSEIRILTYLEIKTPRGIAIGLIIAQILYLILMLTFSLLSTSSIVYTVACFYTSRDITYRKVTRVYCENKLWGKLIVTFLWCFLFLAIYTSVTFGLLLLWFFVYNDGIRTLIFILCLCIPVLAGLTYMMVVWNIATVITVLEKDHYGRKALAKSMRLIKGKIWASCAVFMLLGITFVGIVFTYCYLVLFGNRISMVGSIFVGIGCHLLMAIWIHILLVVHAVVYFVCKSVHNEDISTTVSTHSEVPVIHLGWEIKDVQLEQVQVPV
ncbi:hypothetical protein MKW92_034994 [Papaver armeniacum]|nr:hypothetical protein MKW92_034994 [Papaver armeniacum]